MFHLSPPPPGCRPHRSETHPPRPLGRSRRTDGLFAALLVAAAAWACAAALPATMARAADAAPDAANLAPGLVGEYFAFDDGLSDFPKVGNRKPTLVRVDKQVNFADVHSFAGGRLSENFSARWDGFLKAEKAGRYGFATSSDDGSRLYIDDKLVVDNGGPHGMGMKEGAAELSAGVHKIHVDYFQGAADAGCEVYWAPPGSGQQIVPGSALSHPKGSETKIAWDQAAWKKRKAGGGGGSPNAAWNKMDYGRFLSATIVAPQPADNTTTKAVAVKLDKGGKANVLFDTMMMRYSAGWTGGFLVLKGVAFDGAHGVNPTLDGEQKFGTHPGLGWADKTGSLKDPRDPEKDPYGPMPKDWLRYKGLYLDGDQVTFAYSVNGTDVLETPGVAGNLTGEDPNPVFTRTFHVAPSASELLVRLVDVDGTAGSSGSGSASSSATGAKATNVQSVTVAQGDVATVVGASNLPNGAKLESRGGAVLLHIPAGAQAAVFKVGVWSGPQLDAAKALAPAFVSPVTDPATLTKGGPARWTQTVNTRGVVAPTPTGKDLGDKAAYVVDSITAPNQNPYNSWLRFSGFDFFPDGHTAAICTWSGDVWVVSGIDDKLDNLKWKRFATGLFQPLGLKIVDGKVYVHCRDGIHILQDLNGDGEADFYQCFNNDETVSPAFHEFAFDLQQDAAGNFYIIKGGGVSPGGRGFMRPITANQGTVMRINKDGSKLEVVATGFRAPNGMCVRADGQITTGDNQGSWTPVDRLNWIKPGGFYGVPELSHRTPEPTVTDNPLCWLPYPGWDNSCGDPCWVTSDKWGPFKGELLYSSYGQCTLFKVLKEEAGGSAAEMQGGVVRFPLKFASSVMRLRFNDGPNGDGQLYLCGLKGWQTNASADTAFQRVRYTGKPVYLPTELHVKETGVEITFLQKLDPQTATDPGNFGIEQWNYQWTSEYGSNEIKPSNGRNGHDTVNVKSIKLQPDGKTVFLEIPRIQPVMQMEIKYNLDAADGTELKGEIAHTINFVPPDRHLKVSVGKVEEVTK